MVSNILNGNHQVKEETKGKRAEQKTCSAFIKWNYIPCNAVKIHMVNI